MDVSSNVREYQSTVMTGSRQRRHNGGFLFQLFLLVPLIALLMLAWAVHHSNSTLAPPTTTGSMTSRTPGDSWKRKFLGEGHIDTTTRHRMFILVGAVRTLHLTQDSIIKHVLETVCPPPNCVAHIVTSFSQSDNRPDIAGNDPRGAAARPRDQMDVNLSQLSAGNYRHHYPVTPAIDIGSVQERDAMDLLEEEVFANITTLRRRWVALRRGDPRRASMWFHRAWAWRTAQAIARNLLQSSSHIRVESYFFLRPDMLWFEPAPSADFLERVILDNVQTNQHRNVIWLHDSWWAPVPDTFAFLSNYAVANAYFSLPALVQPGIACLGGPNFDVEAVKQRLLPHNQMADVPDDMWCGPDHYVGWSEQILQRKLMSAAGGMPMTLRFIPAGAGLVRGPPDYKLDCVPLRMYYKTDLKRSSARQYFHLEPVFHCSMLTKYAISDKTLLANTTFLQSLHPFRLIHGNSCLTIQYGLKKHTDGSFAHDVKPQPCWTPRDNNDNNDSTNNNGFQLFAHAPAEDGSSRTVIVGCHWDEKEKMAFVLTRLRIEESHLADFKPEPTQLYP